MGLEEIRKQIDEIDAQLLPLFMARMDCAKAVAEVKRGSGAPVLNVAREDEVLAAVAAKAGEYDGEARVLFATLMDMSRVLQHRMLSEGSLAALLGGASEAAPGGRVAVLGKPGSFTRAAAEDLFPNSESLPFESFAEIFESVAKGGASIGVVPVENSLGGSVSEVYSLILQHRFYIVGARTLHVHQCLAASCAQGVLRRVYSHPQGLAQCSEYLARHNVEALPCSSTAEGARLAANEAFAGAICSEKAARENGLTVLRRDVQNVENNRTRFVVISRAPYFSQGANKISLCFSLPHRTGTLYSVLARFAAVGLSLTKIESRPIAGRNFEYDFYLDFTGSICDAATLGLIETLRAELPRFSFLGNYIDSEIE